LSDFVAKLCLIFTVEPCVLCGTIHPFDIHCYPQRKARNPKTGANDNGVVVCAICEIAHDQGRQYTKRFLPDFLVPGCVIRLDATLQVLKAGIGTPELIQSACILLGCDDERTVKRHVALATASIPRANLYLSEAMALNPETWEKPDVRTDNNDDETMALLLESFILGLVRRGHTESNTIELSLIHDFWQRKILLKEPTAYVIANLIRSVIVIHGGQSP